jgi:tetratricopeptide (TPR) repeat protein
LLYYNQGKYAEAEPLYKRALAISEKALGADHPAVADVLENYASLLRTTGRDSEAEKLEARASAIRKK